MPEHIGTLREGPLHAGLKSWCARPGDLIEHPIDGLVIDLVRDDLLIEIQTAGFAPLDRKLARLLPDHRVRIVHPVAIDTWILKVGEGGEVLSRRKSPRHQQTADVFSGLVSIVDHLHDPRLEIDVVSTTQEQVRRHQPGKAWRRNGWAIEHRAPLDAVEATEIRGVGDLVAFVPTGLGHGFTTVDLADSLEIGRRTAQQMTFCLRSIGAISRDGTRGRSPVYVIG
jgi:hypothetical protein